jgi:hypothetical protein
VNITCFLDFSLTPYDYVVTFEGIGMANGYVVTFGVIALANDLCDLVAVTGAMSLVTMTTSGVFLTWFIHMAIDGIANVKRDAMRGAFLVVWFSIRHFVLEQYSLSVHKRFAQNGFCCSVCQ